VKDGYRIIGAEMSPYSVKVRSYFPVTLGDHVWTQQLQKQVRARSRSGPAGCLEGLCG
jgi:hypothetical protein